VRVHPEYLARTKVPDELVDKGIWDTRFKDIRAFERYLANNGIVVCKFFLHLSKDEQKKRLLERIDDPEKHWKFDIGDLRERGHWEDYQHAYEEAINATSTAHAPWHIVPADDKWYTRLAIAGAIYQQFKALKIEYPVVTEKQRADLAKGKELLDAED